MVDSSTTIMTDRAHCKAVFNSYDFWDYPFTFRLIFFVILVNTSIFINCLNVFGKGRGQREKDYS